MTSRVPRDSDKRVVPRPGGHVPRRAEALAQSTGDYAAEGPLKAEAEILDGGAAAAGVTEDCDKYQDGESTYDSTSRRARAENMGHTLVVEFPQ